MPSCLESKALQIVMDKRSQKLSQSLNKPRPEDNLIAMREPKMPLAMSNS